MKNTTIVSIPSRRYSLEASASLWKKTTSSGKRWYVVGPKETPPPRGWKPTMREAVRRHREGRKS